MYFEFGRKNNLLSFCSTPYPSRRPLTPLLTSDQNDQDDGQKALDKSATKAPQTLL